LWIDMLSTGDIVPLRIEKPAAGGRMIARADGLVVLVAGAIPGERVDAKIDRIGKGVAYASAIRIAEVSADRRPPGADPLCGGCLYAHIAYERQLTLKSLVIADAFARIGRLDLPAPVAVTASPEAGYRMRARLHVRGRSVGFFREGTHEVCDARATRQLLPATSDALDRFVAAMQSLGLDDVHELEIAENAAATGRLVHLDTHASARTLDHLAATDGFSGLSSPAGVHGDAHVTDTLDVGGPRIALRRHVLAFFQGNRYLLDRLAAFVAGEVPPDSDVIDLYAGVGLFSMAAASRRARVTAVEGDRLSAADLAANAATSGGTVRAVHQSVEAFLTARLAGGAAPVVIVDPPRTGLSRDALEGVARLRARRVVYISCDPPTLARDARRLVESGLRLTRAEAFDLFPNTPHVETVAVFDAP
jgi:23S rRNA (uracil1939-C5)-methyltransferase